MAKSSRSAARSARASSSKKPPKKTGRSPSGSRPLTKRTAWYASAPSSLEAAPSAKKSTTGAEPGAAPRRFEYDVHPGIAMTSEWVRGLKEKSGKSLEEWIKLCTTKGPKGEKACRDWLKKEHNLGTNSAWWIAEKASDPEKLGEDSPEGYLKVAQVYVRDMYASKSSLVPIYEALIEFARSLGKDVRISPCKTMVPLYRSHVFAQIKPTTRTRIDLGLCLRGVKASGRLIDTGGQAKGDRITHRVEIGSAKDIDDQVKRWLKQAYDADA